MLEIDREALAEALAS